jgi:uncharacterized protein YbaR (Trm112 family)
MHILLTDVITCPRCGPRFGLILLADEIIDRDVRSGWLGCANCRERYPIEEGMLDLRTERAAPPVPTEALEAAWIGAADEEEAAFRLAALLGVAEGGGWVLLLGATANLAARVAGLLPEARVIAAAPLGGEEPGVSRVSMGGRIPLRDHAVRAMAMAGPLDAAATAEARRLLLRGGRLVVLRAAPELAGQLAAEGFSVLLDQEGVVVASAGVHG